MRSFLSILSRFFLLAALFIAAALPGCAQPAAAPGPTLAPTPEASPTPAPVRADPLPGTDEDLPELAAGNGDFAFDLYHALRGEEGNLFFSPYSLSAALAMTYAGARGETERQMAATLHFTQPQERLHPAFNALDQWLAASSGPGEEAFRLEVANSLWGEEGFPFRQEFLDLLGQNYGAGMQQVDYVDPDRREEARLAINAWVEERTQGKIKDLIAKGILDEATRLVLANAIYFKAEWLEPFLDGTEDAPFTRLDGSTVTVPTMSRRAMAPYAEGDGYQAVELPYKGERISMVALLPAEGQLAAFEGSLSRPRVDEILAALQPQDVKLYMPKFSFSSKLLLDKTLPAMGMPDAFDPRKADFTGTYDPGLAGGRRLYIAHVVHQAFVAVDEEGSEAAAATGVVVGIESMPLELRLDRPFIFLIRDRKTGTVLFLGRLVDPGAGG